MREGVGSQFQHFVYYTVLHILRNTKSDKRYKGKLPLCFLTEHHAMKVYWGAELLLHAFFVLGARWRWVVSITPRPLYPQGKSPPVPRWAPEPARMRWREKFPSTPVTGTEPRSCSLYTESPRRILYLTKHHTTKTFGWFEIELHEFLTSALDESCQLHAPAALPQTKESLVPIG
jgi:hypothetical protein